MTFDTVSLCKENKELAERVDRAESSTPENTEQQVAERNMQITFNIHRIMYNSKNVIYFLKCTACNVNAYTYI